MGRHQPGQVHQALRRATATAHHALDHHRLLRRLTGAELTRDQYAESLAAIYQPHALLEQLVHESRHHVESGIKLAPRLAQLKADLIELGRPIPSVSPNLPGPSDERAAWWGRVYVLEGSRLGGAMISRHIRSSLCDTVPCRFFGESRMSSIYSTLLTKLECELAVHDELETAVMSAQAAFADFRSELDAFDSQTPNINKH